MISVSVAFLALAFSYAANPPNQPTAGKFPARMPLSNLAPARVRDNLCLLEYPITTRSPIAQALFNQGLGYLYNYVWMEAARCFETATLHDPNCAIAYWGLSRALEKWSRRDASSKALIKADQLKEHASWREQQLILARMQETGNAPNVGDQEARRKKAIETIDTLLAVHDDDEEAWYYRAHLAGGRGFGGTVGAVPFYKALLKVNPLHPGANHELVHFYENCRRPALGWIYAENYIKSSPGIPHAYHMQAHLATRLGRWDKTSDRSARAIELHHRYFKEVGVKPSEDHQYSHHLETLATSLIHDGRFAEARELKKQALKDGVRLPHVWVRLHTAERDWAEALKAVDQASRRDKVTAAYSRAVIYLKQGDLNRAAAEVEVLRGEASRRKNDRRLELRLWETQGLLLCLRGEADAGLKLLEKAVERTKNDYTHHAWGNGAYYMEQWGVGALACNRLEVAEEAFLEALAHDLGSVRGALGMQVIAERRGRTEEAARYAALARKFWTRASTLHLEAELTALRGSKEGIKTTLR